MSVDAEPFFRWAGAIAGGISMAAGEWISVSAQNELIERELDFEVGEGKAPFTETVRGLLSGTAIAQTA